MKYSLGYDYSFLAWPPFLYNGELIGGVSLDVLFHMTDKSGKEIYFKHPHDYAEQVIFERVNEFQRKEKVYLNNLFRCSYDRDKEFALSPTELMEGYPYDGLSYEVVGFAKELKKGSVYTPVDISEEEFRKIVREHPDNFGNSDNVSAQSLAYFCMECGVQDANPNK